MRHKNKKISSGILNEAVTGFLQWNVRPFREQYFLPFSDAISNTGIFIILFERRPPFLLPLAPKI